MPIYTTADLYEARAQFDRAQLRLSKALARVAQLRRDSDVLGLTAYMNYANGCTTTYSRTLRHLDVVEKQLHKSEPNA